jgi:hypothetical protein
MNTINIVTSEFILFKRMFENVPLGARAWAWSVPHPLAEALQISPFSDWALILNKWHSSTFPFLSQGFQMQRLKIDQNKTNAVGMIYYPTMNERVRGGGNMDFYAARLLLLLLSEIVR